MLPFTRDQFLDVFAAYNEAIWPLVGFACVVGLAAVVAVFIPSPATRRIAAVGLASMWLWTGIAYHWLFFAPINPAAWLFGALFVVQGLLLLDVAGRDSLYFGPYRGPAAWLGGGLVVYSAVLYPLIGIAFGHDIGELPMFGVTPCPVTLFTVGLLLLTVRPVPRRLLAVPLLWSLVGGSAAVLLGIPQDWMLLLGGTAGVLVAGIGGYRTANPG